MSPTRSSNDVVFFLIMAIILSVVYGPEIVDFITSVVNFMMPLEKTPPYESAL